MVNIEVIKQIDAGLDKTWALFSNFGDMSWLPGEQKVEAIGEGIGMSRRLTIPGIDPFDEILLAMDHDAHTFSYSIPKNTVVPFDNYVADIVISGDAGSSKVVWTSSFEEGDMEPEAARELITGSYQMMLDAAAENLAG